MASTRDTESVERVIAAPPEKIFDLLASPPRHSEIDGSGTVQGAYEGPDRVKLGDTFGMDMKMGAKYQMVNQIIEYDENRRIAWQTKPTSGLMGMAVGGRIWRYELEPVDGGTKVTETWDISREKLRWLVAPARRKTAGNMAKTLERIERAVTA